jgi:YVTN family beta-propeller protein
MSSDVTVIDGATNSTTTTVNAGADPGAIAVNPVTDTIYVTNQFNGSYVTVITAQRVQAIPLTTSITPLPGNQTATTTPVFTFNAQSTFSPNLTVPANVFFQVDTWQGAWTAATSSGFSFTGTTAPLQPGFHILYAYAGDGQEADSEQKGSPLIGSIAAYGFLVAVPAFFTGQTSVGDGAYYLRFPANGDLFGYYNLQDFPILYHYDLGFEYFVDARDGQAGAYFYDFAGGHWLYSNPSLFPYFYDFTLNAWLFYLPDPKNPDHYTTNPREFVNLGTGKVFTM